MTDRVELISPTGRGRAQVAARRVEEFKSNGWREAPKKSPQRRRKATDEGDSTSDE